MHDIKCLREASRAIGFELFSIHQFYLESIAWLVAQGKVEIEGDYENGFTVSVDGVRSCCSGGYDLTEAICGAVHELTIEDKQRGPAAESEG